MTAIDPGQGGEQAGNPFPEENPGTFRPENPAEGADLGNEEEEDSEDQDEEDDRSQQPDGGPLNPGEDGMTRPDTEDEEGDEIGRRPFR